MSVISVMSVQKKVNSIVRYVSSMIMTYVPIVFPVPIVWPMKVPIAPGAEHVCFQRRNVRSILMT